MKQNVFCEHSIVIRRRRVSELADLTLCVIRCQWRPISFYFFLVAIPAMILNSVLYYSLFIANDAYFSLSNSDGFSHAGGTLLLCAAMYVELRFVGTFLVSWLGLWVFHPDRDIRFGEVFSVWFNVLPQLLYYLVLFYPFYMYSEFVPQIILLEQTPFFGRGTTLTTSRRSRYFHRGLGIDVRVWKTHAILLIALFAVVGYFFFNSWGGILAFHSPLWKLVFHFVLFPLYFWTLLLFFCVFSFFRYLNIRITREGWDLDIAFKAEMVRRHGDIPSVGIAPVSFDSVARFEVPNSPDRDEGTAQSMTSFTLQPDSDLSQVEETIDSNAYAEGSS